MVANTLRDFNYEERTQYLALLCALADYEIEEAGVFLEHVFIQGEKHTFSFSETAGLILTEKLKVIEFEKKIIDTLEGIAFPSIPLDYFKRNLDVRMLYVHMNTDPRMLLILVRMGLLSTESFYAAKYFKVCGFPIKFKDMKPKELDSFIKKVEQNLGDLKFIKNTDVRIGDLIYTVNVN